MVGDSTTLGNFGREERAEIGGDGSETNEVFEGDITSRLRTSSTELNCTDGQLYRLFEDFCFVGGLKGVPVGALEKRRFAF